MLPPIITLDKEPFFYYDCYKSNINKTMKDGHYHNYYEIYYLVSGKCDYCIDNVIYSLESNGLIFIPNNVIHKTVYKVDDYERIVLNFTGDYIDPLLVNNLTDVFVCNLKNPVDVDYIAHIFRNINTNVYNKDDLSRLLLRCHITEILAYIACHYSDSALNYANTHDPISKALSYISKNYTHDITLENMAAMSGYNKEYFSRLFKKSVGTGYKEYVLLTRLSAAERLMMTSNKSIKEVAMQCGFNDSNHFSSVFKKLYGTSPLKYKQIQHLKHKKPK